jgi:hypothetical protein
LRLQLNLGLPEFISRSLPFYVAMILAFASALVLVLMPIMDELLFRWAAIFFLVFLLPGCLLALAIFKRTEMEIVEIAAIGLGLSLVIFALMSLALNLYHTPSQLQILSSTLIIVAILAAINSLRDSSKKQSNNTSFRKILSTYKWISLIMVFALTVRLASFLLLYKNAISSDIDIWLVYEVADGKLLSNYTSIWHFFGIAPYSYPILFHLFTASVKVLGQLRASDLFFINIVPSLIPLLFCYGIVKNSYDERSALISIFAFSTAPIFIFDTLPGTFKARPLFYAFISAELYCASRILKGQNKFWPLLFLFALVSSLTYREADLMCILIVTVLTSAVLTKHKRTPLRLAGVALSILGSTFFAFSYIAYTPSLGLIQTLASGLAKQGPLIIFCLAGAFYAIKRGSSIDYFLSTITLVVLAVALLNWKAADSAPIILAVLSGVGISNFTKAPAGLLGKLKTLRPVANPRLGALAILMVGLATTAFGLTYYTNKYYLGTKPQVFDEIGAVRQFVQESKPQRGTIVYGTGYTGLSLEGAYASVFVLGPEQQTLFYTYSLDHLVSTDFDPWIVKHPELVYESTLQLYHSLYTHNGEDLKQFLESFSIQYLIVENTSATDAWAQANRQNLEERFATQHYRVYEALTTKPLIAMLKFIDYSLPEDARVLAPYYMSPSISEVRREYVTKDLEGLFDFNYIHLYERFKGGPDRTKLLDNLRMKIGTLRGLYDNSSQLVAFAFKNGFNYVITDNVDLRNKLVNLGQNLLFSQDNLALLEVNENAAARSTLTTGISTRTQFTLTTNIFDATSYTSERYSLTSPAPNIYVKLQRDGEKIAEGYTDHSGTVIFQIPSGKYAVISATDNVTDERQVEVNSYTFVPIVIHHQEEDPMQKYSTTFLLVIAALVLIPNAPIKKSKP